MVREPVPPLLSVILPTYNRASFLRSSLASLTAQTVPPEEFEVLVVDDGSTDETAGVCREFEGRLRLRYFRIAKSGNPAAKNLGVFASAAPILLFFDDDDVATPDLLREHLRSHRRHPQEGVAILGYTTWAPGMAVSPVMEYVTDVGQLLFAYKSLRHGQSLDYTHFWCGRISCKRSFLVARGVFNQDFPSIIEDVELGYRLSKFNLTIVFNRNAVSHMVRPVTYDAFCRRCERVGEALYLFSTLHPDPRVQDYCRVAGAKESWDQWKDLLGPKYYGVREVEALLESGPGPAESASLLSELRKLYAWTFAAFRVKGIVQAAGWRPEGAGGPLIRPIVVHQMGKVGSKTVEASLKACDLGVPVCHSHFLNNLERLEKNVKASRPNPVQSLAKIRSAKELRKILLGTGYIRNRVITLVRDPVARNVSAFFENLTEFFPNFYELRASGRLRLEDLITTFLTRYEHDIPLRWFDVQMKPVFGIDVFAHEFPRDRGYMVYHGEGASLLLMKLEQLKACAAPAMREFCGVENFVLRNANVGEEKEYRDTYRDFLDAVELPREYLDRMYESKLVRHFYTEGEIAGFRARWAGGGRGRRPAVGQGAAAAVRSGRADGGEP
jgi:glycosyltransferase involved in cell wall biosynthesis